MIYRGLVEGGNTSLTNSIDDAFEIFFSAHTRDEARRRFEVLFGNLFPGSGHLSEYYDCCNLYDEVELKGGALEPEAFADAFLVETGMRDSKPTYCKDAVVMAVGKDRQRILAALHNGRLENGLVDV